MNTQLDFISIQVRNIEASKYFYTNMLGFEVAHEPNPDAVVFKNETGASFAIRTPIGDLPPLPTRLGTGCSLWFGYAGKITEYAAELQEKDAPIVQPPFETPFGMSIVVADPDGYSLTFHELS
jgi:lactoylglutathione lyase